MTDNFVNDKTDKISQHLPIDESIQLANEVFEDVMQTNDVVNALATIEPYCDQSVYHCYVRSLYLLLTAMTSIEKDDIEQAQNSINQMTKTCNKFRKTGFIISFMKIIKTPNYENYTDVEVHAELMHCISLALNAIVLAIETNNIYALIKLAYRLQKFVKHLSYGKIILRTRTNWESEISKMHFESTVRLHNGVSHLIISNAPPKILKVINFLGVKGVESIGWAQIDKAFELPGIGSHLARIWRILYWTYADTHVGLGPNNVQICSELLNEQLTKYPQNLMYNIFRAKVNQLNGQIDAAIDYYHRLLADPHVTPKRFLYFELIWCYALQSNWQLCVQYAQQFRTNSYYTPAIATYMEAMFRYTLSAISDNPIEKDKATELFEIVPTLRIRHLGKTITPEKVAVVKAQQYLTNDNQLILPDMAMLYESNYLSCIRGHTVFLNNFMDRINRKLDKYKCDLETSNELDNYLTAVFYKGVILRLLSKHDQAKEFHKIIIDNESRIGREYSLPAQAVLELGLIEFELQNKDKAIELLHKCIHEFTGYLMENYVHIRAFAALRELGVDNVKQAGDDKQLEKYKKQWLKDINISTNNYEKVIESEDTTV